MPRTKVVVLGAGYAGLMTVSHLQKKLGVEEAQITLINQHDYQYLTTKLHEPAAGTLDEKVIQIPIHSLIDSRNVIFKKGTVTGIDPNFKKVMLEEEIIDYDILVAALGAQPEGYGIPGLWENAFFIWNLESVCRLRNHIEKMFEAYVQDQNEARLTFVVGGAGFTGIEFICELQERIPFLCDKHNISKEKIKILCVEARSSVLNDFDPPTVDYILKTMTSKGVELLLNCSITECGNGQIRLSNGEKVYSYTVVWTGGIRGNSVIERTGFASIRGRVKVNLYLEVPHHPDIYIIGDSSIFIDSSGKVYPPTAQIAIQQGVHCGNNIVAKIRQRPSAPFVPLFRGMIMSLGGNNAAGIVFHRHIKGILASWMKKVIEMRYYLKLGGIKLLIKRMLL
jgi:NADH:ubiquinone reductase (H+-translocating)